MKSHRLFFRTLQGLSLILILLLAATWLTTYHPGAIEAEAVTCNGEAPRLQAGQSLRIYQHNVQFMAGKEYVFFFNQADGQGPDERPSAQSINRTLNQLADLIQQQNPDLILLQEIDDGAQRTGQQDQLQALLERLPDDYRCSSDSFYWKAAFVPHPRIKGSVGMKLAIISKYQLESAARVRLPKKQSDPISPWFNPQPALFEVRLPLAGGHQLAVLTTHLSGLSQGSNVVNQQIQRIRGRIDQLNQSNTPWLMAGVFNLLPPGGETFVPEVERERFPTPTPLMPLLTGVGVFPPPNAMQSATAEAYFTHDSNDPALPDPDRTLDYLFYAQSLRFENALVLQAAGQGLSDHFPIIAELRLPPNASIPSTKSAIRP